MNNFDQEDHRINKALLFFAFLGVLLIASAAVVGTGHPANPRYDQQAESQAAIEAADQASNEAIEKEAHSRRHAWVEVELSKLDGHCDSKGSYSARAIMEIRQPNGPHVESAQKVADDDYVLTYQYLAPDYTRKEAIFVTSESLCERVIHEHFSQ